MQRFLVFFGLALLVVGLAWPWLAKFGLGRLPGDIRIVRDGFSLFIPLTTSIVISLVLTVILWILRR